MPTGTRRPVTDAEIAEVAMLRREGRSYAEIEERMGIGRNRLQAVFGAMQSKGVDVRRRYRKMPGMTAIRLRIGEMHHVEGMTIDEIAEKTGLTGGQVRYACRVWANERARRTVEKEGLI